MKSLMIHVASESRNLLDPLINKESHTHERAGL